MWGAIDGIHVTELSPAVQGRLTLAVATEAILSPVHHLLAAVAVAWPSMVKFRRGRLMCSEISRIDIIVDDTAESMSRGHDTTALPIRLVGDLSLKMQKIKSAFKIEFKFCNYLFLK